MRYERLAGSVEVLGMNNPGGRGERFRGGHGTVVVKILTFPRQGLSHSIF